MPSSSSSSGVAVLLAVGALVALARAAPSPGAAPDRHPADDPAAYSRSGTRSAPSSPVVVLHDGDRLAGHPNSSVDLDRAAMDEVDSWLDVDDPYSGPSCSPSADADRLGRSGAPSPEPVPDADRRAEGPPSPEFDLDDYLRWCEAEYGRRASAAVRARACGSPAVAGLGECVARPRSDAAKSDRPPGKRTRSAANAPAGPESRPSRGRVRSSESAAPTESAPLHATPAPSAGAASHSGVGARPESGRPKPTSRRCERVWAAIVQKGLDQSPISIPDGETHPPCYRFKPIPGAVPHLNDHSDLDQVMSHYVRWFGRLGPRLDLQPVDLSYRANLQHLIHCHRYHCGGDRDKFLRRHRGFQPAKFYRWCSGVDACNHREKTLERFRRRLRSQMLSTSDPKLSADDLLQMERRLGRLAAADPDLIDRQREALGSAQKRPSDPGRVPRLNDFAAMRLVLAHFAAAFGPNGTHREPAELDRRDLIYRRKLARLLNCFFCHAAANDEAFYGVYGARTPGSCVVLCNGVDDCNGDWMYSDCGEAGSGP